MFLNHSSDSMRSFLTQPAWVRLGLASALLLLLWAAIYWAVSIP
jgi:hypothetical protein